MMYENDHMVIGTTPLSTGPQPGWMTLNEARERNFTGEVVFETDPETYVYFDHGVAYYAERTGDMPISQRLLDAGLVDAGQLERGTVRVGNVEHLGRLFERDPSVDRDAVLVVTESMTEQRVAELANETTTTVRFTAYRHHPSGLHRWFVAAVDPATNRASSMSTLEAGPFTDIPGLPLQEDQALADQLYIEWDELLVNGAIVDADSSRSTIDELDDGFIESFDDSLLQAILDGASAQHGLAVDDPALVAVPPIDVDLDPDGDLDVDTLDDLLIEHVTVDHDAADLLPVDADAIDSVLASDGFQIMWPNGEMAAPGTDVDSAPAEPAFAPPPIAEAPVANQPVVVDEPVADDELTDGEIVAVVPDEVAESVRRAIALLESAPAQPVQIGAVKGFAPPSLATSAEVMYARASAAVVATDGLTIKALDLDAPIGDLVDDEMYTPASSVDQLETSASDDDAEITGGGSDERSSALRRLIGSLRRKQH